MSINTNSIVPNLPDVNVDLSIPVVVVVSSNSNAWVHSEDDPSFLDPTNLLVLNSNVDTSIGENSNYEYDDLIDDLELDLPSSKGRKSHLCKAALGGVNGNSSTKTI
jgi:hypothetical protein